MTRSCPIQQELVKAKKANAMKIVFVSVDIGESGGQKANRIPIFPNCNKKQDKIPSNQFLSQSNSASRRKAIARGAAERLILF